MRTTVTLAADVYAEVERMRAAEGIGPSEALNTLARRGMLRSAPTPITMPAPIPMGAKVDVNNVGELLEMLDAEEHEA